MAYSDIGVESDNDAGLNGWLQSRQFSGAIALRGAASDPRQAIHHSPIRKETVWRQPPLLHGSASTSGISVARWHSAAALTPETTAETASGGYLIAIALRPMNIRLSVVGRLVRDGITPAGMMHISEPGAPAHCLFRGSYDALHLFVSHELLQTYGDDPVALRSTPGLVRDPIVQQLALSLLKAESFGTSFASLYADGIAVAIVTRLLALQAITSAPHSTPVIAKLPKWRLKRAIDYIDAHLAEPVSLADIANATGLSRMHFAAQFKATTGYRPHEYLLHCRIARAQTLLADPKNSVVDVALEVGFETQSHFTTVFKRLTGLPPRAWRQSKIPDGRSKPPQGDNFLKLRADVTSLFA